jgi:hypothetical protein
MNTTRAYKCTVCNKIKNIQNDPIRAVPNSCTITLGCTGSLNLLDTQGKNVQDSQSDWVARGQNTSTITSVTSEPIALMSVSSNGALTLAVKMSDAEALNAESLNVKFEQRRTESVKFAQFTFMASASTNTISGKDNRGRNLRIDSAAVTDGRIRIKVNGVTREDFTVTPGQNASVQFTTAITLGSTVDIFVYFEKEVEERTLQFVPNWKLSVNSLAGAWGNVKWVFLPDKVTKAETKYWLFTATSTASMLPSSYARLVDIVRIETNNPTTTAVQLENTEFLFSKKPFSHFDRFIWGTLPATSANESFQMLTSNRSIRDFTITAKLVASVFPAIKVYYNGPNAALSTPNIVYSDKGVLIAETIEQNLPQSNFLIGEV